MKVTNSTEMTCTTFGSSKYYNVQIHLEDNKLYSVYIAYGAIGKPQRYSPKVQDVSLQEATKVYHKVIKEKTSPKKGYVIQRTDSADSSNNLPSTPPPAKKTAKVVQSDIPVQLLNAIDKDEALQLIQNSGYIMQVKYDGERRPVEIRNGKVVGLNRRSEYIGELTPEVAKGIDKSQDMILDTEDMGDHLVAFDVLEYAGQDVTSYSFTQRMQILEYATANHSTIKIADTAVSTSDKAKLLKRVTDENGEGVVFKLANSPYTTGRPNSGGSQLKFKLYDEASVVVIKRNTKRSVQMGLVDSSGETVNVGNVTIPANAAIPKEGDIIEVKYLYAYQGGSLYQPSFLKTRTDIDLDSCLLSQLKYKPSQDKAA